MSTFRRLAAVFAVSTALIGSAAEPTSYYSSCENKSGESLLKALHTTISSHTNVGYDGLWTLYKTSDVYDNGKIWDMYSTKQWTYQKEQCGTYSAVGSCYNREHSFPKSWFSKASPMVSDAFHIYPTDGKVNNQRGNYPFGECANGTTLPSNGSVKALGRLGTSTTPGYSGVVFEPDDQYKGDFARSYFYMAACYYNKISGWKSDMLSGKAHPAYKSWALDMLLKWHRQDPVSSKETKRNDAVYAKQKNRNPFIDHPELVEYIWGDKQGQSWTTSVTTSPEINQPVAGSTINIGSTAIGHSISTVFTVKATGLTEDLTISSSSPSFTFSPASVSASSANSELGTKVTVSFNPMSVGTTSANITLRSGTVSSTFICTATTVDGLPVMAATEVGENEFTANWTYVGDELPGGFYCLSVFNEDESKSVGSFNVQASAGSYKITDLNPATLYSYTLASATLSSQEIYVTTSEPVPSITIMYDGDLSFSAEPGEPSEAAELLIDTENIDTDYTITVSSPFELSTDRNGWSQSITLTPDEDRCYMRVNSGTAGTFTTYITAQAGTYVNDDATVMAIVATPTTFFEDFEQASEISGYDGGDYQGTATHWFFSNAGIFPGKSEAYEGLQSARFGKNANSYIEMSADKPNGVGTVNLYANRWSSSDGNATIELLISTDHGTSWTSAGSAVINSDDYKSYTFTVNSTGNVRLKIQQTAGKRLNIDNISATNYSTSAVADPIADYHAWDAYCRDGRLVITVSSDSYAAVYGADGITYLSETLPAGETAVKLPRGLYIVSVGDFTRRVVVK